MGIKRLNSSPLELTKAELATLRCLAARISIEDIAAASNVKVETIKLRIKIILEKLQLTAAEKNMLAAEALKRDILSKSEVSDG